MTKGRFLRTFKRKIQKLKWAALSKLEPAGKNQKFRIQMIKKVFQSPEQKTKNSKFLSELNRRKQSKLIGYQIHHQI